ncbi:MAG: lysophospholipid acyltransferase family protein [Bacteroidota bacterium]
MLLFLPGIILPGFFGPRAGVVTFFFMKLWSWVFSKLNRIPYETLNRHHIEGGKAYIYVSNHTSFLDLPGIAMTIRGQFRPLAKKELLKLPVFGWITRVTCVVVDRSSNESRRKSMDHLKRILSLGISILIFPEGTQNRTKEKLQPFYDGAFRIAVETQSPVLPLVVVGANKLMPPGTIPLRPGKIKVVVGKPIPTEGLALSDVSALKERVRNEMLAMLAEHLPA